MDIRWDERLAARTRNMSSSSVRELLKITERPGVISFAGGMPAPELFPLEEVEAAGRRILRSRGHVALQYSATEGYRPLRELLAARLRDEGLPVTVDNVLITTGSQQAIDLVGKIFLDPGDTVLVESPTYVAALQSWNAYEALFETVHSDDNGMDVDAIDEDGARRSTLVYCLPNFQNPRGVTLSRERRERLAAISLAHSLPVVEDDPYRDLRFEGEHLPRLISLDADQRKDANYQGGIINLGTFSKILAPGLRVGWVVAAPTIIAHLTQAKQGTDLHTSTLDQMIAFDLLESGFLDRHREVIVNTYRHRRDVMLASLAEHLPDAQWTRPEGGMFLWVDLPSTMDAADVLREAMERKLAFVPGVGFHADGTGKNTLRLNFSNSTPEQIQQGIAILGDAVQRIGDGACFKDRTIDVPAPVRAGPTLPRREPCQQ